MATASSSSFRSATPYLAALALAGCAVGAPNAADDSFFETEEGNAADAALDAGGGGGGDDLDGAVPWWWEGGATNVEPIPIADASRPGIPQGDASAPRDSGSSSAPRDSGASSASRDAGTSRPPTSTPTKSACDPLSCADCSVAGPFPCCTVLDTCGCTWAPGAYCI